MRRAWGGLTRRQILTLAVLFAGDVALLLAGWTIVRGAAPAGAATPVSPAICQAVGAQLLASHNLAGTARLDADGWLRLELSGRDTFGQILPRATEIAWDVFPLALALPESGCGPYPALRVDVPDSSGQPGGRLLVEVYWIDLRAWAKGELDDGELSLRLRIEPYIHPEPVRP
jgi:hypothetical protein